MPAHTKIDLDSEIDDIMDYLRDVEDKAMKKEAAESAVPEGYIMFDGRLRKLVPGYKHVIDDTDDPITPIGADALRESERRAKDYYGRNEPAPVPVAELPPVRYIRGRLARTIK